MGGGSIVNIAGVSGLTSGASKGGVVMLSKAMATDLAPFGIRVNVIAPGPVEFPLAERTPSPHARQRWTDATPLERYARPDEIAGAAVFFCSIDASFVTGQVLAIDGAASITPRTHAHDSFGRVENTRGRHDRSIARLAVPQDRLCVGSRDPDRSSLGSFEHT